ncbi:acyl-CoA dehydrogenase (plasmid) [Pseudonocardia sp. EC080610-09]|uniref:acyl-CoA dehydrogenase family protein n=1 Tax=unclassified Pseudonocardia TaxID=2619320 RepID=UPI00070693B3|nr:MULTISPECIES: acyl-CoA dehydrogenase family protein [unclassified Pseudonocardia]ALL79299.1 acyl-CoA dehydrogenase [Pseudonocardia sp. EC080610-09]ALL85269.1 acyl-CoA dehydrogenase [Pseudonocardia sp. EC080619-01]
MTATIAFDTHRPGPAEERLRDEVREHLDEELVAGRWLPRPDAWMSEPDPGFSRRLGARGWLGMTLPSRYGGHDRSPLERFVVVEELLAAGAPVAAHWIADRQMAPSLLRNGTEKQRLRYLPGIARGECFFAIGMSEPDSGSDLASVRTRARVVDGGWRLSGTKVWTTGAHHAHAIVVLARTDGTAGDRHVGLSQFVVDLPGPGIEIRPIVSIDGEHHFNEVVFDDAELPPDALLGVRGEGWAQVTAELGHERSGPERFLSTIPLLEAWAARLAEHGADPVARRELGLLTARAWALRGLSLGVAHALAQGRRPDAAAALVKDMGSRFEGDVVETVRRLAGVAARPGAEGLPGTLASALLHSPAFTLRGGTNEILRSVVTRGMGTR